MMTKREKLSSVRKFNLIHDYIGGFFVTIVSILALVFGSVNDRYFAILGLMVGLVSLIFAKKINNFLWKSEKKK